MKLRTVVAAVAVVASTVVMTGAPVAAQGDHSDVRIAVVVHGNDTSRFWSVVENGVRAAEADLGATVDYYNLGATYDLVKMAQLIDAAVASQPDGLAVSIPDIDGLRSSIEAAVAAGIPVVSLNSGSDVFQELGIRTHVGSDERVAGLATGRRLGELGVTNAICVNDEVGNVALDIRCDSAAEGLAESGGKMEEIPAPNADPIGIQNAVAARLQADPTIDGLLTMGPDGANPSLLAIKDADMLDQIQMATFDLGADTLNALIAGEMVFAVDQQQFLQGYLPVVFLTLNTEYLLMPGGGQAILSGPNFVTAETAGDVLSLAEQQIR
jgi:simple sugar transport system substrate-binding protein